MRVRLSARGMVLFEDCPVYDEFRVGRPSFEVESYGDCYLHKCTGTTFAAAEVEPASANGPEGE